MYCRLNLDTRLDLVRAHPNVVLLLFSIQRYSRLVKFIYFNLVNTKYIYLMHTVNGGLAVVWQWGKKSYCAVPPLQSFFLAAEDVHCTEEKSPL